MKQILCLSGEPWSKLPGRTQQLMSRMRDVQILYFSPPAGRGDLSYRRKGQRVRPNITAYTLPPALLPVGEQVRPLFLRQQRKVSRFIAQRAAQHRFQAPLLWVTRPEHVHLLDGLSYDGLVYDCDREWEGQPPHWEGTLAHVADVVFVASPLLADRLSPCSANIALLPNGLNLPLFAPDAQHPDPLPQIRGPVLGWAGTIRGDLDLAPVLYAARERPDWTFVLLGRVEDRPTFFHRLRRMPNVLLPGPRPAADVPAWLYRCDVLLALLREDQPYGDVISPRMLEYLATGKPIVSMLWPDQVEQFPDVVYGAKDEADFLRLCAHALEEASGFALRRRQHAAEAGWPRRVSTVERILTTAGLL